MRKLSLTLLIGLIFVPALQAQIPPSLGWYQIPNTKLAPNCPNDSSIQGTNGCAAVILAWGGGTADTKRNRLLIWGGGHNNYYGNEVYALDLNTLTMSRITGWTTNPTLCVEAQADGRPSSRHTYYDLAYIVNADKMFSFGGAPACTTGIGSDGTWTLDLPTLTWQRKDPTTGGVKPNGGPGLAVAVHDPNTNLVFVEDLSNLYKYDHSTNTYTMLNSVSGVDYHQSGVIDPTRKMLFLFGGNQLWAINIAPGSNYALQNWASQVSGCSALMNTDYPGLAFDTKQSLVVGWAGGNSVYQFNPDTKTCTAVTYSGGPGAAQQFGTNGRFAYMPSLNLFVVMNDWQQNAFTLRLTEPSVTSIELTSTTSGTYPFTVGLAFKKGDVPTNAALSIANQQVIKKSVWNDGSVKHAIASGRVALTANTPLTVNVVNGSFSGTNKTCSDIQTANPAASIQLGSIGTVALSSLLASPFRTWISGPEMVECHYRSGVGSDPTLQVWFHVRLYADNRVWVRASIENGLVDVTTADKNYIPTVMIGGTTVYNNGGATLSHPAQTRWTAEGWIGGNPQITPKHNTTYLEASKLVPNYFNQTPSSAVLSGLYQTYTPMQHGDWTSNMGDTGFQQQIGLLPQWDALFITSKADARAYNSVLANTKALNSYPIVWNDSATKLPTDPTLRPTYTVTGVNGGGATSVGAGSLSWDVAHHGSGGYLAYLITGDYYYYETLEDQATMCYLMNSSTYGSGVNRQIHGIVQDRGQAWCIRTLGQFASLAPSSDTVAANYKTLLTNSISELNTSAQAATAIGYFLNYDVSSGSYSTTQSILAPWQQHFLIQSLGMGTDIEPLSTMTTWNTLRDRTYLASVGILGPNGSSNYCFTDAGRYNMMVADTVQPPSNWYPDWGTVWTKNHGGVTNTACGNTLQGSSGGDPANASTGYWGNLMPAIAYAADHGATGASASWSRLTGATNWTAVLNSGFGDIPIWGIQPRSVVVTTSPAVSLSPTSLNFGNQTINTTSASQSITLTNTGTASLSIASITLTGTNPGDFAIASNTCGTSLAQSASCVVGITFRPVALASRSANLTFTTNASSSPNNAALSGTGTGSGNPAANFIPATFTDFGSVKVGLSSGPVSVVLKNSGNATMNISSIVLTGTDAANFSQTNNCPAALVANATCTINVTFSPMSRGSFAANITVRSNTLTSPDSVGLNGIGTAPVVVVSTTGVNFFNQLLSTTSAIPQVVTLSNIGDATLNVSGIVLGGVNLSDFGLTSLCTNSLQAGSNCTISLTFTPSNLGARAATLTITDDAAGSPRVVSVSGTGARVISGSGSITGQGIIKVNP